MSRLSSNAGKVLFGCGLALASIFLCEAHAKVIVLHAFAGGSDGARPEAALLMDASGTLYGTTFEGGGGDCSLNGQLVGCGTVFRIGADGTETELYAFQGGTDGAWPFARLSVDTKGNFYGSTSEGGTGNQGTVFRISPDGNESVLHSFAGVGGLADPLAGILLDVEGNLYGTTYYDGDFHCNDAGGCGTVFALSPDNTETVVNRSRAEMTAHIRGRI